MNIVQHPGTIELSGNLTRFIIQSDERISFLLKKGADTLIDQYYDPGTSGIIEINLKEIIEANLSYLFQDTPDTYQQPNIAATFTATINTQIITFTVIRAGVDNLSDTPSNFLQTNFLTWQPQRKHITYYNPEYLTYHALATCKAVLTAYYPDNTTETITLSNLQANTTNTIPLQYATINNKLTKKLPAFFDIHIATTAGEPITYTQRYILDTPKSEDEQWILFENTLGGLDTFRAYGKQEITAAHTHNIATNDDISEEYHIDTSRTIQKNTGYLDNYQRRWLLDFFPSKRKYIYQDNQIRPIVVTECDVKYITKELPTSFNFTFKYAQATPYLNLIRNQELPPEIHIEMPDVGDFTLPPRLHEYPHVTPTEGALIPIQLPFSDTISVVSIAELKQYINEDATPILSIRLEDLTAQTVQDGHIAIKTNDDGELFGELHWIEE